jgi:type VI secretion system protein ImpK
MAHLTAHKNSLLSAKFDEFATELTWLLRHVQKGTWEQELRDIPIEKGFDNAVWQRLWQLFSDQAKDVLENTNEVAYQRYREAQYAMIALADDIFLRISWSGKETWKSHLLESEFFQTQAAGERLFQKIEHQIKHPESGHRDLCAIYFWVLGLGFQGKYADDRDKKEILLFKRDLFQVVRKQPPLTLQVREELILGSRVHTSVKMPTFVKSPIGFLIFSGFSLFFLLVISQLIWVRIAAPLEEVTRRILLFR